MRRWWRVLALLVLLGTGAGCSIFHRTDGNPVPWDLSGLERGTTTKAEALEVLGAPESIRRQFDGDLLIWTRRQDERVRLLLVPFVPIYERTRGSSRRDLLTLLFDHEGVLQSVGLQQEIPVEED